VEEFLESYCNQTCRSISISFDLFSEIAFDQGIPAITTDLLSYLTGAHQKPKLNELLTKAFACLYDRVEPRYVRDDQAALSPSPSPLPHSPGFRKKPSLLAR
jgi:hypothetical protein